MVRCGTLWRRSQQAYERHLTSRPYKMENAWRQWNFLSHVAIWFVAGTLSCARRRARVSGVHVCGLFSHSARVHRPYKRCTVTLCLLHGRCDGTSLAPRLEFYEIVIWSHLNRGTATTFTIILMIKGYFCYNLAKTVGNISIFVTHCLMSVKGDEYTVEVEVILFMHSLQVLTIFLRLQFCCGLWTFEQAQELFRSPSHRRERGGKTLHTIDRHEKYLNGRRLLWSLF